MQNTYAGISVAAVRLDDPTHKVMTYFSGSGGAWGRRGVTVDSTGIAWTTTGDGIYNPTANPPNYGNSVIGVHIMATSWCSRGFTAKLGVAAQARPQSE